MEIANIAYPDIEFLSGCMGKEVMNFREFINLIKLGIIMFLIGAAIVTGAILGQMIAEHLGI